MLIAMGAVAFMGIVMHAMLCVHRHPDGAIDIDFYRRQAATARSVAKSRFIWTVGRQAAALVRVAIAQVRLRVTKTRMRRTGVVVTRPGWLSSSGAG
jgi:hypothetical protein